MLNDLQEPILEKNCSDRWNLSFYANFGESFQLTLTKLRNKSCTRIVMAKTACSNWNP